MEFINYNANPKKKKTGDCVIRAICTGLKESWEDTYKGMLDVAFDTYQAISYKKNFEEYLKRKGYIKQKMPKKDNGNKYTIKEFANELAKSNTTYIISIRNHLTTIINKDLYDIWDCSKKSVGNYWIIDDRPYSKEELNEMINKKPVKKRERKRRIEL